MMRARSALDRLTAEERTFGSVGFSASAPHGVHFGTARRILFFGIDGSARAWSPPQTIASLTWMDRALQVATTDGRCFRLDGPNFSPVPGGSTRQILAAQAQPGGGWTLLTPQGPARWSGPGAPLVPVGGGAVAFFQAEPAQSAVFLADGRMAFGRVLGGVAACDREGGFLQNIDRAHGLPGNRVEQLSEDVEGGLWIAQRAGLARVQLDTPFAKHGLAQGVAGRPRALQRHDGRLYIAHIARGARHPPRRVAKARADIHPWLSRALQRSRDSGARGLRLRFSQRDRSDPGAGDSLILCRIHSEGRPLITQ